MVDTLFLSPLAFPENPYHRLVKDYKLSDPHLRPALAYATAWLQVAEGRSVLPPWVKHRFPATMALLRALRDLPCAAANSPSSSRRSRH